MRADYQVEVLVSSYQNPRGASIGRINSGQFCCDGQGSSCSGFGRCDNYFSFCLRELNATSSNSLADCPLGRFDTTIVLFNDDDLTFVEGETALNGLPNPLVFANIPGAYPVSIPNLCMHSAHMPLSLEITVHAFYPSTHT